MGHQMYLESYEQITQVNDPGSADKKLQRQ